MGQIIMRLKALRQTRKLGQTESELPTPFPMIRSWYSPFNIGRFFTLMSPLHNFGYKGLPDSREWNRYQ
jgi:hypothetical protein